MRRHHRLLAATVLGFASLGAGGYAFAGAAQETASELRATGFVGERFDGYLDVVGDAPPRLRSLVEAVNIRRRADYTELARMRRVQIEEVAATTACEIFASRVLPGQYYLLPDGVWRRRQPGQAVTRPSYCI